jgi:hypothetical protein
MIIPQGFVEVIASLGERRQKAFRTEVGFVFARRNQPGPVLKNP